ncbi:MAG: helix-turn-helix domain-containing protein [Acidaminococcales bacterium]|jgi:DNA-binding XRE family transcriptional regulator|nr:helix-turn-helix domain-containing protein [Acidaminococcales bacterium]
MKPMRRENLISARKSAGYTQKNMATLMRITERHYRTLEAGSSNGSIDVWRKLAKLFGVSVEELFGEARAGDG